MMALRRSGLGWRAVNPTIITEATTFEETTMLSRIFAPHQRCQLPLLAVGFVSLTMFLVGCSLSGNAPVSTTSSGGGVILTSGGNATPPPFPPFTIGAWVSDQSPQKGEQVHLYVLARVQDPTMMHPAAPPPPGLQITANIQGVAQQSGTDSDGFAKFDFNATAPATLPQTITVFTSYNNVNYQTTTFFTVLPQIAPPTPGVTPTATKGP